MFLKKQNSEKIKKIMVKYDFFSLYKNNKKHVFLILLLSILPLLHYSFSVSLIFFSFFIFHFLFLFFHSFLISSFSSFYFNFITFINKQRNIDCCATLYSCRFCCICSCISFNSRFCMGNF